MNNYTRLTHTNRAGGDRPMNSKHKPTKETIKITCHYQKNGTNASELINQSFQIFTKSCIIRHDEWSLVSGGTICTQK